MINIEKEYWKSSLSFFSFNKFGWHDRVFSTSLKIWKAWDLIQCGTDFLLNLWDNVAFPELIKTQFTPNSARETIYPWFFDSKYLDLLHWMVYQRYSTYNNVLKSFISFDIPQILSRESKVKPQTKKLNLKEDLLK